MIDREGRIDRFELLQSRPENLNENMEDEIKSAEHRGWNKCNSEWWEIVTEQPRVDQWIPCSEDMPAEHESVFARFKGTSKWMNGMFEKCSDDVLVTVKFTDGSRKTMAMHTTDGEWRTSDLPVREVIAWMPMPESYKEGAGK